jgi:hypothetical protein
MADIRLFLPDLDAELDVAQDRQFPLALNYTAGSLRDINNRTTNFSLELRIPANKNNKTALKHLNDTNVLDGSSILSKTSVVVKADGIPIFTGDFKLLGSVNDRGHEEFKCILLGDGMDWAEGMRNKTPRDYNWGSISSYDKATIESYWHTLGTPNYATTSGNNGIQFPLVHYGAWTGDGGATVNPQDLKPAMFMRSFFEKAFNDEGYTVQMDTDADDFFNSSTNPLMDRVLFPFTGTGWKIKTTDSTNYESTTTKTTQEIYSWDTRIVNTFNLKKNVTKPTGSVLQATSLGGDGTTNWNSTNKVVRFYLEADYTSTFDTYDEDNYAIVRYFDDDLTTVRGEVFEIIRYGTQYIGGIGTVSWVDLLTDIPSDADLTVKTNRWSKIGGSLRILSTAIGGATKVDFDTTNRSLFNIVTDEFTADKSVLTKFNFDCRLGGISQGTLNEGIYQFQIIHKRGTTETVIGEEIVNATNLDTNPIESVPFYNVGTDNVLNLNYIEIGFESGNVSLESGDTVWVEVLGSPEETSSVFDALYEKDSGTRASISAYVKNTSLKSYPVGDIQEGYSLGNIADVLDDRFKSLDYIKGCIHAFNLLIDTNPNTKVVRIKTRDSFYDTQTNAVDWTSKIDLKKQYVIDYLDDYKRNLIFKFKDDSADGYLKERNTIAQNPAGEYDYPLSARFDEGDQNMENPLFAYTYHMNDSIILDRRNSSTREGIWLARMWKEYGSNNKPPTQAFDFRPRLLVYQYAEQKSGQVWNWAGSTSTYAPTALPNAFSNDITADSDFTVNLGYNDWNESGLFNTYYNKTANTIEKSTRVSIPMRLTFKDISTLDLTKLVYISQPADLKGYYIIDRIKNFLPSAYVTTQVELVKKEDYSISANDSTQDGIDVDWDTEAVEDPRTWSDRGTTKWETGKGIDEQETIDAFSRDQELNVKNDRNVAGLGDIEGALKDSREKKTFKKRGEQSAVLANSGNFSPPSSGNAVMGKGNVAVGKNQTVMGTFSEPTTKVVMAVGAGTSKAGRYNAFSVGTDGVVREGQGYLVTEVSGNIEHVWEEVNGELVKIVI